MNRVTIVIPVSRPDHLDRLFHSLEMLECDRERTNLLTYVDGDAELYLAVRNFAEGSKFDQRLCVQRPNTSAPVKNAIPARRIRIAAIHNELKALVGECDYVMGIEDDTIVPSHALTRLLRLYGLYPFAGFVQGVEVGRWGINYIGAWKADDVYEPTKLRTLLPDEGIEEIDAGGFYCFLTKRRNYVNHDFKPFDGNNLGPDVDFGLAMRREGFKNYIDWSVLCAHKRPIGQKPLTLGNTKLQRIMMVKDGAGWEMHVLL